MLKIVLLKIKIMENLKIKKWYVLRNLNLFKVRKRNIQKFGVCNCFNAFEMKIHHRIFLTELHEIPRIILNNEKS